MGHDLLAIIAEGEAAIAKRLAAGKPIPPDWLDYLEKARREAARRGLLPVFVARRVVPSDENSPSSLRGPRYAPGCLYDYIPGRRVRPTLRCVAHAGCPRIVVIWRAGILAEMFTLEKLVGQARQDGEREWMTRGNGGAR